jgi:hypothetical protein
MLGLNFCQTNLISLFSLFLSHPAQPISLARSLPLSLHVGIAQKRGHRALAHPSHWARPNAPPLLTSAPLRQPTTPRWCLPLSEDWPLPPPTAPIGAPCSYKRSAPAPSLPHTAPRAFPSLPSPSERSSAALTLARRGERVPLAVTARYRARLQSTLASPDLRFRPWKIPYPLWF